MNPQIPQYLREPQESFEFAAHQKRGGAPYSEGHRRCYLGPIELLKGQNLPKLDILEIGTGIGYGMELMAQAGFVAHYYGVEPDEESYNHALIQSRSLDMAITLFNEQFENLASDFSSLPSCDFTFCIEVTEHIAAANIPTFLTGLRARTKRTLFLSTPDGESSSHGVATADEWKRVLQANGFDVVVVKRQWTTLFVCGVGEDLGSSRTGVLHAQMMGGEG